MSYRKIEIFTQCVERMRPTDQRAQPPINVIWRMSKEKYLFVFTLQSVVWQNFGHGVYVFWACQESRTGTRQIIIIRRFFYLFLFWTSYIGLCSMVRPSVHPSIRLSVRPSAGPSVRPKSAKTSSLASVYPSVSGNGLPSILRFIVSRFLPR